MYESARLNNIDKVIFASSNHALGSLKMTSYKDIVKGNYDGLDPQNIPIIDHNVPIRPDSYYGISKAYGESLGDIIMRMNIQSINLRIGTVQRLILQKIQYGILQHGWHTMI